VGTLYLVATPIGNLDDITGRALKILKQVNLIAAEDTRQTRKLLAHYQIDTPLISYHEHNKLTRLETVLETLSQADVALVSDAGTPALNDPGYELVRAAVEAGYCVSPIPGPSAPLAALVASGLPTDAFVYLGYLPRKRGDRRRLLNQAAEFPHTLIFLETPHRLLAALQDLQSEFGDRPMAVARELTKLHEEIFRGRISEARDHFADQTPRGEFTLVVAGKIGYTQGWSEKRLREALQDRLGGEEPPSQIAAEVSKECGWPRREVYRLLMEMEADVRKN
jgi:16S rRNA (cytidine1402-2'-O)-methyltransferase